MAPPHSGTGGRKGIESTRAGRGSGLENGPQLKTTGLKGNECSNM